VNGKSFGNVREFRAARNKEIGGKNTYLVKRGGQQFEVTIVSSPLRFAGAFKRSGLPYMVGICYMLIGTLVFLMKPHQRMSWIFFLFAVTFGLYLTFLVKLDELRPLWLGTLHIFLYSFIPATFVHMALSFPEERTLIQKHPYIQIAPYIASGLLFMCISSTTSILADVPKIWSVLLMTYLVAGMLIFLGSCFQLWISSSSEIVKLRSKIILLGAAISASIPLIETVTNTLFRVFIVPSFNYYLPFFVVFPLFVGYSIVKHNLFDIDAIIKRTYGYILTTGAIAGIYSLVVLISNLAFARFEITKSPFFPLAFILAVVFLFNPIRDRAQKFIDRVFYRLEYDYQETVQKISESLKSLLSFGQIGQRMMEIASNTMFMESGCVFILKPEVKLYEALTCMEKRDELGKPIPSALLASKLLANDPLIEKISQRKKELTIYDIQEDPLFEQERETCQKSFDHLDAALIVPLVYEDSLTGLMSLGNKKSGKFYRREDINLLRILANQGAVAIENARLFEENIQKSRMEEELKIARNLQTSMLPDKAPTLEGFSIAARSIPAREVGGDFYDFIEIMEDGGKRLGIVVGDVSGKAVSGALVMAASRSIFRVLTETNESVEQVMNRANTRLQRDVKKGMFVALLYAVLDPKERRLTFSNAGQVQPILCSPAKPKPGYIDSEGDKFPLGIVKDCHYEETRVSLKQGDVLVFSTDGIVEAINAKGELYGFERFLTSIEEGHALKAHELLEKIINDVMLYAGNVEQHDDLTAVVVKVD
jgi:serine phosphatase RsbU (regulator of sigma subunit)